MTLDWLEKSEGWSPNEDGLSERAFFDAEFLRSIGKVPINDLVSNAIAAWAKDKSRGYHAFDLPAIKGHDGVLRKAVLVERLIRA